MPRGSIRIIAGLGAGLACAWLAVPPRGAAEERGAANLEAQKTWQGTCRPCHTVPDATYETDRAFLRQITETS